MWTFVLASIDSFTETLSYLGPISIYVYLHDLLIYVKDVASLDNSVFNRLVQVW